MSERLIELELARLNLHLPERRLSLKEALSSSRPEVRTKGGGTHSFKRAELELLSRLLPESQQEDLKLPILLALDPKLGRGAARVSGRAECRVVGEILGKGETGGELLLYRPQVALVRRKLPTTTQYLFMV